MSDYVTRLRRELSNLEAEREIAFMRDDFAITNGTIRSIDREIYKLKELIREVEEESTKQAA